MQTVESCALVGLLAAKFEFTLNSGNALSFISYPFYVRNHNQAQLSDEKKQSKIDVKLWKNIFMETIAVSFSKPKSPSEDTVVEMCGYISQIKVTA